MFDYDEKTYARIALRPHINKNYTKYMRLLSSDFRKTAQHRAVISVEGKQKKWALYLAQLYAQSTFWTLEQGGKF